MQTIPTASAPTLPKLRGRTWLCLISSSNSSGRLHPSDIPFLTFAFSSTCCWRLPVSLALLWEGWMCGRQFGTYLQSKLTATAQRQTHKFSYRRPCSAGTAWHCNRRRAWSSRSDYCTARHLWQQQNQKLSVSGQTRAE